jgi:hypothetical protein
MRPEPGQSGVHGLLQGERMWIEPEGFAQVHTRGNLEAHRLQQPGKWTPYGVGPMEGQVRDLPVLPADANGGASKQEYGPGEEPRPREGEPTGSAHGELL